MIPPSGQRRESTKTRIETGSFLGYLHKTSFSQRRESTKTRIETYKVPLNYIRISPVREGNPLKQGLKLKIIDIDTPPPASQRRESTKTRIETNNVCPISPYFPTSEKGIH